MANRHPLHEMYRRIAEGKTPTAAVLTEYGVPDSMAPRVRRDTEAIHALHRAGGRKGAWDLGRERADALISALGAGYREPEKDDPRELAARIAPNHNLR
jgi:hypothetical protein